MPIIKSKYSSKNLISNPTFAETIHMIKQPNKMKPKTKVAVIILALLGIRLGELRALRKHNIVFFDFQNMPVMLEDIQDNLTNVKYVLVEVTTSKQRTNKKKIRRPVIPVNNLNRDLLITLIEYIKTLESGALIYPHDNSVLLRHIKKQLSPDFYPHLFRHIAATRDGLANMNIHALKKKYGWSNIDNAMFYIDLNAKDLFEEENRVYGLTGNSVGLESTPTQEIKTLVTPIIKDVPKDIVKKKQVVFRF